MTPDRGRTVRAAAAGALALLLVLAPVAVDAQRLGGTVLDRDRDVALPGAALLLLDSAGAVVDSTRADARGRFRLTAPAAGTYTVHVHLDGWAGVPSDPIRVEPGVDRETDVRVPLIGPAALRHMSSMLDDESLQRPFEEMCGEALRPWEAGVLLGVIRDRATRRAVAGARVVAYGPEGEPLRSTISNDRGNYILCNLPAGLAIRVVAEAEGGARGETDPEIRRGVAAWYDIPVRP